MEIDLLGRPLEIRDTFETATRKIQYDNDKWTLDTVEWTDGPLEGFKLDEDADARGRLGTLTVSKDTADLYSVTHAYRGDSDRIDTLTFTATGAPAVEIDVNGPGGVADELIYKIGGQPMFTYSRSRNAHGRLSGISAPGFSQSWNLDAMGRVKDLTTNGKTTTYGYNPVNGSLASAVSFSDPRYYTFSNRGDLEQEVIGAEVLAMLADPDQSGAIAGRENLRELKIYGTFHTNAVVNVLVGTNVVHNTAVTPFEFTFDETTLPALTDTNAVVSLDWSVVGTRPEEPGGTPYEGGNAVAEIAGEHLFAPQAESVTYDIATRRASDAFLNYGWDAANQPLMLEERHGPHRTEHDYDGSQRRVEKRVYHNGNLRHTHRFVYDGWLPVVEEVEDQWGNFAYRNLYVWGPGPGGARQPEIGATGQLALIIHQPKHGPPQLGAPIYNHRLDVVGLVDVESGQVVARYGYTPFGKTTYAVGARADQNPFRFAGAYFDQETDTYYFGYRHYHPRTKQWISRDPIGEAGGLNLFAYANNDPINGIDVLGLEVFQIGPRRLSLWETPELESGNNPVDYLQGLMDAGVDIPFEAMNNVFGPLGAGSPADRFQFIHNRPYAPMAYMHGQYINMLAQRRERAASRHQEYVDQIFWDVLQENGEVQGLDFFRYWMLTQHNGLGFVPLVEGIDGHDLYATELNNWQRTGRVASGSFQVVTTAMATQQAASLAANAGRQTVVRASTLFRSNADDFYLINGRLVPAGKVGAVGNLGPRVTVNQNLLTGSGQLADHHIFPSQFRNFFKKVGINIDDYTVTVDHFTTHLKGIHGRGNLGQMPGRWNKIWSQWIDNYPNASLREVFQQGGQMMDDFGLNRLPIHGYKQ